MTWFKRYKLRKEILNNLKLIMNSKLNLQEKQELKSQLSKLKQLVNLNNYAAAREKLRELETHIFEKVRPPFWLRSLGWLGGIVVALALALLIRQEWFELYEIPSGSMRPTLKEADRLSVSKTCFGINFPFSTGHLWFDPHLVKRNQIFTFTGEGMDIDNVDTTYFGVFPGKRQFVKRICGKPLDRIYFQGGQIYGLNHVGDDLFEEFNPPYMEHIEHVPIIGFEWNVEPGRRSYDRSYDESIYYLMNEPVACLRKNATGNVQGEWCKNPLFHNLEGATDFFDLMGIKHYAQTRILWNFEKESVGESPLIMELRHHPSFKGAKIEIDQINRLRPMMHYSVSHIHISNVMIDRLFSILSTGRFVVTNGKIQRYPQGSVHTSDDRQPKIEGVANGIYEFINGKAYKIQWGGIAQELNKEHPLLKRTPARLALFYNLGYEFDERRNPSKNSTVYCNRFAYFRGEDLFVQGHLFLSEKDVVLQRFIKNERLTAESNASHVPFVAGPNDRQQLKHAIEQYGITIPNEHYLALGDNPPVSGDSREFGMVPQGNLRGSPVWVFWPPGPRWGVPPQPKSPWINPGRAIIWGLAACGVGAWIYYERRKKRDLPKWQDL